MITFPFLFGVMFGDIGHGGMLLIVGILLCWFDNRIKMSNISAASEVRYLVLLMGFFATFIGFCYNDFMSIPINMGSCYTISGEEAY